MNKNYDSVFDKEVPEITDGDMELINGFSQKKLKKDEVFVFSVILCDNEIDRDFERFTVDSIEKLAELFVGKTAIKNHSMNSEDQSARTFKTEVVRDETRLNSLGEQYVYLKAYCYIPRIKKYETLIEEIQTGIKKEVSIGCSVEKSVCSVCSQDVRSGVCTHKKGRKYNGKLCFHELVSPTDAYEWSFVAVPAQRNAGVTKKFDLGEKRHMNEVLKAINSAQGDITVSAEEAREISRYINGLTEKAKDAEAFRESLEEDTVKCFAFTVETLSNDIAKSICGSISTADLRKLNAALKEKKKSVVVPQLAKEKPQKNSAENSQFRF